MIFASPNSFLTNADILVGKTAVAYSNLGIGVFFIGATQDFAINRLQWDFPAVLTNLKYVACPQLLSKVSVSRLNCY